MLHEDFHGTDFDDKLSAKGFEEGILKNSITKDHVLRKLKGSYPGVLGSALMPLKALGDFGGWPGQRAPPMQETPTWALLGNSIAD